MTQGQFAYRDRRSGEIKVDTIYARGFLDWLYNTTSGWLLTQFVMSRRWVSRLYGWWYRQRWTRRKIPAFVEQLGVDLDESMLRLEEFESFNHFITREIDLSRRPIDPNTDVCICPADARVRVYPRLEAHATLLVKRAAFDLPSLLCDEVLAERYAGGAAVIARLYLADYHHFHFPDDGIPEAPRNIRGRCFATSPYSRTRSVPFLNENSRFITVFDSDHFGKIAIVEVGAFTIGSIRQCYQPFRRVRRGTRKGYFELGGSVVLLLFAPGAVRFDADLVENSASGIETYVPMGASLGRTATPVLLQSHSPETEASR
jgi:phosphatidylserine decarboxylase